MDESYPMAEDGTSPVPPAWYLELRVREVPWSNDFVQRSFVYEAITAAIPAADLDGPLKGF